MQKTLTVKGERFTGKQIAKLFTIENETDYDHYNFNITLNGKKFIGNYRCVEGIYAPVCSKEFANAVALLDFESYKYIWMIEL